MDLTIYPQLTKKYILERINQEDIMEKYLNTKVVFDTLILCPPLIRAKDNNPTFGFKYSSNGKLRCRDFGASGFWGDCFDVVARYLKIDSKDGKSFYFILHTIAKDFKIHKYVDNKELVKYDKITNEFFKAKKRVKPKLVFKIVFRAINYHDKSYWSKFNISPKLLTIGKVYFAQEIFISYNRTDFKKVYTYNPKDPSYCYYGGKDNNGISNWKIYYPLRKKSEGKFHSNSSFLQGEHLLQPARVCVITKSYKDVLAFKSIGLQSCAPSAESILINKNQYFKLSSYYDFLVSCMDYDRAGMRMAQLMRKTYGITPIMFTNGYYNTFNYKAKDLSEYIDNTNNINEVKKVIGSVYNSYNMIFNKRDLQNYNNLKFIK